MEENDKYVRVMKNLGIAWEKIAQKNHVKAATGPDRRFTWIYVNGFVFFFNESEDRPHTEEELQQYAEDQIRSNKGRKQ